jgi:hypothetical protein
LSHADKSALDSERSAGLDSVEGLEQELEKITDDLSEHRRKNSINIMEKDIQKDLDAFLASMNSPPTKHQSNEDDTDWMQVQ